MELIDDVRPQLMARDTIWSLVSEDEFRYSLVSLEQRTNAIPIDVQNFELSPHIDDATNSTQLPLAMEHQFTNDIAFIAAVNEGAQSVAAVCLEQHVTPLRKVKLRVAAADTIDVSVRTALDFVCDAVARVARSGDLQQDNRDELFGVIINLHLDRILGRLRSNRWHKPKHLIASHKKPLWRDFDNVVHRVQHVFPSRKERGQRENVQSLLQELAHQFESFETIEMNVSLHLANLVRRTFDFCHDKNIQDFYKRLGSCGTSAQISAALKCMHQLEKIGSYQRIATSLLSTASQYPEVFSDIELHYLAPYPSRPTEIAYEQWAKTCHVHAEIQLIVDFDIRESSATDLRSRDLIYHPRVIGTSKYLCYLCYLFIKQHGHFCVTGTHGRLYDQWTVPDLAEYSAEVRLQYAMTLASMTENVLEEAQKLPTWRPEPMTSRQNLLLSDENASHVQLENQANHQELVEMPPSNTKT